MVLFLSNKNNAINHELTCLEVNAIKLNHIPILKLIQPKTDLKYIFLIHIFYSLIFPNNSDILS